MNNTCINIKNLTKSYKDLIAVDNLNLTIYEGELFALLGVNGAGKTTTIKMLSCLTKPTSGEALIYNYSINNDEDKIKNIIALSMQETAIARNLTVKENLEFIGKIYNIAKQELNDRISFLTNKFSLTPILNKKSGKLSGGWQRKLSIALALIVNPKVLFLDEPTIGLDVLARRELWDIIESLKGHITIILTTHYLEEAEKLANRIGIMINGKLKALGTSDEIKESTNTKTFEDAFVSIATRKEI